jgi:hypothetical protein
MSSKRAESSCTTQAGAILMHRDDRAACVLMGTRYAMQPSVAFRVKRKGNHVILPLALVQFPVHYRRSSEEQWDWYLCIQQALYGVS